VSTVLVFSRHKLLRPLKSKTVQVHQIVASHELHDASVEGPSEVSKSSTNSGKDSSLLRTGDRGI